MSIPVDFHTQACLDESIAANEALSIAYYAGTITAC